MGETYFLRSHRLGMRPLAPADIGPRYLAWLNDPVINKYSGRRFRPTSQAIAERYLTALEPDSVILAICTLDNNFHFGNIKYGPIDWFNRCAEIEILIGEKTHWYRGYATEAISLVSAHLFTTLRLHRVEAKTSNPAFAQAVTKLGWKEEGVLRDKFLMESGYADYRYFALLESEYFNGPSSLQNSP